MIICSIPFTPSVADLITAIATAITSLTVYFAYKQWKRAEYDSKAQFLKALVKEFYNGEVVKFTLKLDYEDWKYDGDFHDSADEHLVDNALAFASYVCYLYLKKRINADEFKFFMYDIGRLLEDDGVVDYLYNVYHFSASCKSDFPFHWLYVYAQQIGAIKAEEFENPNEWRKNDKFNQNLDWE